MNKLLINSLVTGIFMSAAVVYADDAHHPEQSGAAVVKSAPGKSPQCTESLLFIWEVAASRMSRWARHKNA
jgi:hypothetical protein